MALMYKQLTRQIFRNKIFVGLLLLLTLMTSLSFFFVRFSIDGNMTMLEAQPSLTENQLLYQNALTSNTSLAYTFLLSLTGLTGFVFAMFFYRFFRSNRKQIGCLKSLGFKDKAIRSYFVVFVAILSTLGAVLGLLGGYFLSSVLLNANTQTYSVTGLVKAVSPASAVTGLLAATVVFCTVAFACYGFVRGKEAGVLIAGNVNKQSYSATLRAANAVSNIVPVKNKFPLRIALRKPIAVVLMIVAVMAFSVCIIIGRSLNISSQKVMESQMMGHAYEYDVVYDTMQSGAVAEAGALPYLRLAGLITFGERELEYNLIALYGEDAVFTLQDDDGQAVLLPSGDGVVIGPGLADTYGVRVGDALLVSANGNSRDYEVLAVAANAKTASIYMDAGQLASLAGLPAGSFNGMLRAEAPGAGWPADAQVISKAERIEELERNAVSNNVSAIINQATGVLVGCVLIFLALYVSAQDNTRDMLILHLMGYRNKAIRKMLVNVYQPIVWFAFLITLAPSIWVAQGVQRSLSITTNDYMPFGTTVWVVLAAFIMLNVIYLLVQAVFGLGIKRIVAKGEIAEYTTAE